ncbi:MAG TPA: M23 family metallopeptidase [Bacteroidales bacterium]|mgnify:FL=1|jgi:hypothetical protein|nr:hypothetical protein [Bacteroidales bacterium]OQC59066.1 MAG: Glycyl-glycine endopeptidase LytM precursor [Bacteroidetes bacterium ADurb.Bin012]HNR27200.1 M23 family metallopeptidase [Bacteroidales bacterium]HNT47329.1 M23 family metallopeptidase [Bacteroidales bacterium]HNW21609.1 M23 family metallopeptidase [Bacteroidales bacterium]
MKKSLILLLSVLTLFSCERLFCPHDNRKIEVVINDIPFKTEVYYRIPYTLKTWEWEKEGLRLQRIEILECYTNRILQTIEQEDLPFVHKDPLPSNPEISSDKISNYYLSIQLPIELSNNKPSRISHRFILKDTLLHKYVTEEGGKFTPRINEVPLSISSPVKGDNWIFINQSTNGYHFYTMFFVGGNLWRGERFAFDNLQLNDQMDNFYEGDPKVNESYFNYKDTLYAVADGTIHKLTDGRPQNNGDAQDVVFASIDEYGGNYVIQDIGNGLYAFYAHCAPNEFFVAQGDFVKEGDPIGLLGNSGNSTAPHLHFQITNGPSLFFSNGQPFVIKSYTKVGDFETGESSPAAYTNAMMEVRSVISFGG